MLPAKVERLLDMHDWLVWENMKVMEEVNELPLGVAVRGFKSSVVEVEDL